ncbi:unnamed protein product [Polarella glacialis]|uniref:Uncharacterized protein n=1 Tax=Polarella glacialis TaxID=89957 RepID=A0A813LB50_POLGL|nr:unnamed protein product [Polarella glacialis]
MVRSDGSLPLFRIKFVMMSDFYQNSVGILLLPLLLSFPRQLSVDQTVVFVDLLGRCVALFPLLPDFVDDQAWCSCCCLLEQQAASSLFSLFSFFSLCSITSPYFICMVELHGFP